MREKTHKLSTGKLVSLAHRQMMSGRMSLRTACNIIDRGPEKILELDSDVWTEALKVCRKNWLKKKRRVCK